VDPNARLDYCAQLSSHLQLDAVQPVSNSAKAWTQVQSAVRAAAETTLPTCTRDKASGKHHDPRIAELSSQQRDLRLQIANTTNEEKKRTLKLERNQLLHQIRRLALEAAEQRLDRSAEEVERLKDGAKMFKAVNLMKRKKASKPKVADVEGRIIGNDHEAAATIQQHFSSQFNGQDTPQLQAFVGPPTPLMSPITVAECEASLKRLNNGRAAGADSIPGELLKYGADVLSPVIADIFNSMFRDHCTVDLGEGVLIPLPKPNKPVGPPANLRPIVLLTTLRKTLSLIVLRRISAKVEKFLAPTHSGFRPGRSTADVIWSHRWLAAKCEKRKWAIELLGIDMSKAFDTIRRDKLLEVLETFLDNDEVRMIRVLLSNTHMSVRVGKESSGKFHTTIGTPQGDSLSPVLFIIYLEAALREVRLASPPRPLADAGIPSEAAYADDVDFMSTSSSWLIELEGIVVIVLAKWFLNVNPDKTEHTILARATDRVAEEWRTTKKLGSLLGAAEDIARRKQLAAAAFTSMFNVWKRRNKISERLRLRLYSAFILPILTYNSGTWGVSETVLQSLDAFHRRQLRSLLGLQWPQRTPNAVLYERCKMEPLSHTIKQSRWRLFGHILRLPQNTPAVLNMYGYFNVEMLPCWRGRPRINLPVVLLNDLKKSNQGTLTSSADLDRLRSVAADRARWRELCSLVCMES